MITTTTTTTNVINTTKYSSQQNQINQNTLFSGNLVDELSKAINKEEIVQQKFIGTFLFANPILNTNNFEKLLIFFHLFTIFLNLCEIS
jgi:hypothetical protein